MEKQKMISLGTVKKYCRDDYTLIKNYQEALNDETQTWECHHWNEQWFTRKELIKLGRYYKVPHDELVFMTHKEHHYWHSQYGAERKEKCRKLSESLKGEKNPNFGKTFSEEHKQRLRENHGGGVTQHSEESKQRMSESHKGKPLSEETKQKMREKKLAYWAKKRSLKNASLNPDLSLF